MLECDELCSLALRTVDDACRMLLMLLMMSLKTMALEPLLSMSLMSVSAVLLLRGDLAA